MGLSWQQGPLGGAAVGRFLMPEPLPRTTAVRRAAAPADAGRFGGDWIADSEDVVAAARARPLSGGLLPAGRRRAGVLAAEHRATPATATSGATAWFTVQRRRAQRAARRVAAHRPARARQRAARPGRVRLAGDGRLLRGGRAHRRPRRRRLPPHRHPPDLPPPGRPRRATASSPTPRDRWCSTNPASRRAGTSRATTSTRPRCARSKDRPSARTRAWPATTTSATHKRAAWSYPKRGPRSRRISDLVSFEPDESRSSSTASGSRSSRGSPSCRTASTAAWTPTRSWSEATITSPTPRSCPGSSTPTPISSTRSTRASATGSRSHPGSRRTSSERRGSGGRRWRRSRGWAPRNVSLRESPPSATPPSAEHLRTRATSSA